ncbi:hypothetical protein ACFL23_00200 [Patescibacteria group bacterium]
MLRAAAKNYQDVVVVIDPYDYYTIIKELRDRKGSISIETREQLMLKVFARTKNYDTAIYNYLNQQYLNQELGNAY